MIRVSIIFTKLSVIYSYSDEYYAKHMKGLDTGKCNNR